MSLSLLEFRPFFDLKSLEESTFCHCTGTSLCFKNCGSIHKYSCITLGRGRE